MFRFMGLFLVVSMLILSGASPFKKVKKLIPPPIIKKIPLVPFPKQLVKTPRQLISERKKDAQPHHLDALNDYPEEDYNEEDAWMYKAREFANSDTFEQIKERIRMLKDPLENSRIQKHMKDFSYEDQTQFLEAGFDGSRHRRVNPEGHALGKKRVIFYNGIATTYQEAKEISDEMSKRLAYPVDLIHFQTNGRPTDIHKIRQEHFGTRQRSSLLFEKVCRRFFQEGAEHVYVFGHSGARAGIYNTIKAFPKEWKDKMSVVMFGGAGVLPKDLAHRVVNYCSENDTICQAVTMKYFAQDLLTGAAEVTILENKRFINKFLDHAMTNPTYQEALKKELRKLSLKH